MIKKILIVHYNTPLLTECLVKSINKHIKDAFIYIFDNSDKSPFTAKFDNVKIIDNTKGQVINFNEWLKKYPRSKSSTGRINHYASAKHCYTIEKCMGIINDNFVLLDSDVLIKKDFSELYDENIICASEVIQQNGSRIKRSLPFICYINNNMCKSNGVHYFNENYMHGLNSANVNTGDNYDTGAYFYLAYSKFKHKDIKYSDYVEHYGSASWNRSKMKGASSEKWLNRYKKLWDESYDMKKVIYTCITGNYDKLIEPKFVNDYDFVCFTDNPSMTSRNWKIRKLPDELLELSKIKQQRCIKVNPHKYLKEYDISIWVDGNVELKKDPSRIIDESFKNGSVIGIPTHPVRKCIYEEEKACIALKKDKIENTRPQIERYKSEGFPNNFGLPQSNIIIRKHNDKKCIELMEKWWGEIKNGSHRDQLSFSYALWRTENCKIVYLDKNICFSEWFRWKAGHNRFNGVSQNVNVNNADKERPENIAHGSVKAKPYIKEYIKKNALCEKPNKAFRNQLEAFAGAEKRIVKKSHKRLPNGGTATLPDDIRLFLN